MTATVIMLRRAGRDLRWPAWKDLVALRNEWLHRLRSRRELAALSDRCLRDIGLTRCDAQREVRKPFWRA